MEQWRIGCSGFYYKHWKEIFYPKGLAQKKWFEFYCSFFDTLELNVTFYRFPELSFLENWYGRSPDRFVFSVKAPRIITHYKKFTGVDEIISQFYHTISEGLKEKLGCVLFQLPPSFSYSANRLEKICSSLEPSFTNVVEFRHTSWWNAEVYHALARHNITFCGMSHPALPEEVIQNTGVLYYRFHGVPDLYRSPYPSEVLHQFVDAVASEGITKRPFVYFNNDIGGSAISNALEMMAYCKNKKG